MASAVEVSDYRELARRRLPRFLFDYIDGGAFSEQTLSDNVADLRAVTLRQRVLRDVSQLDLSTTILGERLSLPVVLAPVGFAGFNARRGEVQASKAAQEAGIPFCLSTLSICSIDELAGSLERSFWFQLYVMRDRSVMDALLAKAKHAGCTTLVFTVDLPVAGIRYRDYRSGASGAPGISGALRRGLQIALRPRWTFDVGLRGGPHSFGSLVPFLAKGADIDDFVNWISRNFDASINWDDLVDLRNKWKGKLIVKGILDVDDARAAANAGVDAIIVSNHGGRQLDSVPSTVRALPKIAAAIGDQVTLLVDGGANSGLDVVKFLGLGADAVMLGRAWAFALAAGGRAGVENMLHIIEQEIRVAMALAGVNSVLDIGPDILV